MVARFFHPAFDKLPRVVYNNIAQAYTYAGIFQDNEQYGRPPLTPPTYLPGAFVRGLGKEFHFNMFAVIKSGGLQHKVSVGQTLEVNRLDVEDGAQITIDEVLLISDEDTTMIGTPFIADAQVIATAVGPKRGKKLIVFKYKAKKRYRHRRGHRQDLTVLTIDDIVANGKSLVTGSAPVAKENKETSATSEDELVTPTTETTTTDNENEPETETPSSSTGGSTRRRRTARSEETENETEE